ncbi:MAG: flagellar hook-length control protein FliK [Armatimonadota bacterium]|nr:flagellar hook-length control protein FliK [Armatimonadota bacterium]
MTIGGILLLPLDGAIKVEPASGDPGLVETSMTPVPQPAEPKPQDEGPVLDSFLQALLAISAHLVSSGVVQEPFSSTVDSTPPALSSTEPGAPSAENAVRRRENGSVIPMDKPAPVFVENANRATPGVRSEESPVHVHIPFVQTARGAGERGTIWDHPVVSALPDPRQPNLPDVQATPELAFPVEGEGQIFLISQPLSSSPESMETLMEEVRDEPTAPAVDGQMVSYGREKVKVEDPDAGTDSVRRTSLSSLARGTVLFEVVSRNRAGWMEESHMPSEEEGIIPDQSLVPSIHNGAPSAAHRVEAQEKIRMKRQGSQPDHSTRGFEQAGDPPVQAGLSLQGGIASRVSAPSIVPRGGESSMFPSAVSYLPEQGGETAQEGGTHHLSRFPPVAEDQEYTLRPALEIPGMSPGRTPSEAFLTPPGSQGIQAGGGQGDDRSILHANVETFPGSKPVERQVKEKEILPAKRPGVHLQEGGTMPHGGKVIQGERQIPAVHARRDVPEVHEFVNYAALRSRGEKLEVFLHLQPRDLGEVEMHVQGKHKEISAEIFADRPLTVDLVQARVPHLRQSLEEQGIHVQAFEVALAGGREGGQGGGSHHQTRDQVAPWLTSLAPGGEERVAVTPSRRDGRIDLIV